MFGVCNLRTTGSLNSTRKWYVLLRSHSMNSGIRWKSNPAFCTPRFVVSRELQPLIKLGRKTQPKIMNKKPEMQAKLKPWPGTFNDLLLRSLNHNKNTKNKLITGPCSVCNQVTKWNTVKSKQLPTGLELLLCFCLRSRSFPCRWWWSFPWWWWSAVLSTI